MLSPREKLAAAVARVSDSVSGLAPYFGAALTGLVRKETTEIETLAVSKNGVLFWNAAFVGDSKMTVDELAYSLMHETMHVLLKHHDRAFAFVGLPASADPRKISPEVAEKLRLANLAEDACINEELRKIVAATPGREISKTPDWWIYPESLGQPEGLIFEDRLRRLLDKKGGQGGQGNKSDKSGGKNGQGDGQSGSNRPGAGHCGSCSGHPAKGEPMSGGEGGSSDARSDAEMDRIRRTVAEAVKARSSKMPGTVPSSLDRWADEILTPPKVDWRTKLARIVRSAVAYKAGMVDLSWARPSRRQGGLGYGVGRASIPAYRAPVPEIAVVLDTSGSMGEEDLAAGLTELSGVLNATGASVTFAVCDADVHGITKVATVAEAAGKMKGGGGTDMRPAFDALEKLSPRPEVVIVMTDGCVGGGIPESEPSWCKTIFVLVGEHRMSPCSWGEQIEIDDGDDN